MADLVPSADVATPGVPLPFVGRDAELALLSAALERALAGEGQLVLLAGEPGIGKTRTAEQTAVLARARGARMLWGNCYEWEGAPPFWPWAQIFAAWLRPLDDRALHDTLGSHAALLAQIVPDIAIRLPEPLVAPPPGGETQLFHLLVAASTALRRAAANTPLMIVLDDIHWADKPSLQLLHFLAQEIRATPVMLIATYRHVEIGREHPAAPVLADLARAPNCHRIALRGLPKPQIARFMALVAGTPQPPGLVDAVEDETAGNPFFVAEVVRLLADEGRLGDAGAASVVLPRVPESVREAIRRRLDRLSPVCAHALAAAAVIGREFDLRLLQRVMTTPALELLDALDEAARAHLLAPVASSPKSYRFSHALVQETLAGDLPAAERARLHLAIGEELEAAAGDSPWEALAHHFHHALPLGDPLRVVACAERAGESAVARFAWDTAAIHYARALEALDAVRSDVERRRCDLLLALGEAQNRAGSGSGDVPAARENLRRAFALARALGDPEGMARAAVGYVGLNIVGAFGGVEQATMLEEALAVLDLGDSPLRVRVLGRLAVDLTNRSLGTSERASLLADEAVAIADRLAEPATQAYARWARCSARSEIANLPRRRQDAEALRVFGERAGDPLLAGWGHTLLMFCLLEAGNTAAAEQAIQGIDEISARAHIPYLSQRCAAFHGMLDLAHGRYASAAEQIALADRLWQSEAPRQHRSQAFALLRDLGRVAEFTDEIVVPDELHVWRPAAQAQRMLLALDRRQPERARLDYEVLIATGIVRQPTIDVWYSVIIGLAEAAIAFRDREMMNELPHALVPAADRLATDGRLALCYGPLALALGQLTTELSRWEEAERYLAQALAISERGGLRPSIARTLLARAQLHVLRGRPGDRRIGRALGQRALAEAEAIGMHGLEPACRDLLANLTPGHDGRFGLTARELEVLRLVADGLSDAAIAERLFLSPRTVNSHLTAIYAKLDVSSRLAAAQVATEHDLV